MHTTSYYIYFNFSTCFGQLCAHHQDSLLYLCDTGIFHSVWAAAWSTSHLPVYEDGTDSVPKRRYIQFRHRVITQKKVYSIQNTAKVWNREKLDDSTRLDVVEIARNPDMLPSLFPSWSGEGLISTPAMSRWFMNSNYCQRISIAQVRTFAMFFLLLSAGN